LSWSSAFRNRSILTHYYQWVKERDVTVMTLAFHRQSPSRILSRSPCASPERGTRAIALSIDIDAVRAHEAPGASASNPRGLKAPELEKIAYLARRRTEHIRYMDLVEKCPPLDGTTPHPPRSVRAFLFWFCKGFGERRGLRAPRRRAEEVKTGKDGLLRARISSLPLCLRKR
jgi:hypothetical protein